MPTEPADSTAGPSGLSRHRTDLYEVDKVRGKRLLMPTDRSDPTDAEASQSLLQRTSRSRPPPQIKAK